MNAEKNKFTLLTMAELGDFRRKCHPFRNGKKKTSAVDNIYRSSL